MTKLRGFWADLKPHVFLIIGQALCWLWMFLFSDALGSTEKALSVMDFSGPSAPPLSSAIFNIALLVVALLFWRQLSRIYEKRWLKFVLTGLMIFSALLVVAPQMINVPLPVLSPLRYSGQMVMDVAAVLQGIGVSFILANLNWRAVLLISIIPIAIGALLISVLTFLPVTFQIVLLVLLPPIFMMLICHGRSAFASRSMGIFADPVVPGRYCATAFIHGLSSGVAFGVLFVLVLFSSDNSWSINAPIIGMFLVAFAVFGLRLDYNQLLYRCGLPLVALGLLTLGLVPTSPEAGCVIYLVGYYFVNTIMNCLNIYFVKEHSMSPVFIVCLATLFLMLGKLIGTFCGGCVASVLSPQLAVSVLGCCLAFLVPVTALFCLNGQNMVSGWGSFKLDNHHVETDLYENARRLIAIDADLSEREADVFEYLSQGWSRKRIAEELLVSEETVKSYTSKVYRKLGVHSKQELIDVLGEKARTQL